MPRNKQHKPPPAPRPSPTHFLALPINTPSQRAQLEESLGKFRDAVVINDLGATTSRNAAQPPTTRGASGDATTDKALMRAVGADNAPTSPHESSTHANEETRVVPPGAVRPVGTIHFTLGVMHLPTPSDVERAVAFLQNLDLALLTSLGSPTPQQQQQPFAIDLVGLKPLPSASKATVLFIEPAAGASRERLQRLVQGVKDAFVKAEPASLMMEERKGREEVLLHATVVNTVYARKGARNGNGRGRVTMDVRALVGGEEQEGQERVERNWGNSVWAKGVEVGRLCICEMGAEKVRAPRTGMSTGKERAVVDERYREVTGVNIPW
ncbi:MAG: hypothetical protein OHK93_003069 [Ramalina farinacea]|uniref:A-kinase anchor protein 7-like phosphoesterase domain-containing protein n=1 Tax=Ramalina farinacea TaxID=258253 RepID=A0AA43QVW6_9LECA|nr:hypothetical protein [Ramalina farinacea]